MQTTVRSVMSYYNQENFWKRYYLVIEDRPFKSHASLIRYFIRISPEIGLFRSYRNKLGLNPEEISTRSIVRQLINNNLKVESKLR